MFIERERSAEQFVTYRSQQEYQRVVLKAQMVVCCYKSSHFMSKRQSDQAW